MPTFEPTEWFNCVREICCADMATACTTCIQRKGHISRHLYAMREACEAMKIQEKTKA
jgi:hypothetical protein